MDKASGVYITITDNSIQTSGSVSMKLVVPMFTKKGNLGLNRVTATDLEDIVGYDLDYNSNYYGLRQMAEMVSYLDVWRLNHSYFANEWAKEGVNVLQSDTEVTDLDTITEGDKGCTLLVAGKYAGDWRNMDVMLTPKVNSISVSPSIVGTAYNLGVIMAKDYTSYTSDGFLKYFSIYDATNVNQVAWVDASTGSVYRDASKIGLIGSVAFTAVKEGEETVGYTVTLSLDSPPTIDDSIYNVRYLAQDTSLMTLTVADNETHANLASYDFSLDETSEIYWGNDGFSFGPDVTFWTNLTARSESAFALFSDWVNLQNGEDNKDDFSVADLDTSVLDLSGDNILAFNGFSVDVPEAIAPICKKCNYLKILAFVDAPDNEKFTDLLGWRNSGKVPASEYVAIGCRPDKVEDIYVWPSVSYVEILANMMAGQGNMNYPPAGPTYGTISTSNLMRCDYEMYADEMKTNRLNWQRIRNNAAMMWEQRTTYALNSDLSYIAPVFILDDLTARLVEFESNFNFRYMTRSDILTQQSGLTSILDSFVANNFLYTYELKMPTYEEAQKGGRTLVIPISVVIMKDSEVIQINLELNNA